MVKIPEERVKNLRGEKGEVKKKIEKRTGTNLKINSNEIEISGADGIKRLVAKNIVKAIGRGFDPEIALLLAKPRMKLEIIKVSDYAHTDNSIRRLKGRVIGRDGRIKKKIEDTTKVYLSIYGKTIGIIGEGMNVAVARKAVMKLLEGKEHSTALEFLNRKIRELNQDLKTL